MDMFCVCKIMNICSRSFRRKLQIHTLILGLLEPAVCMENILSMAVLVIEISDHYS